MRDSSAPSPPRSHRNTNQTRSALPQPSPSARPAQGGAQRQPLTFATLAAGASNSGSRWRGTR